MRYRVNEDTVRFSLDKAINKLPNLQTTGDSPFFCSFGYFNPFDLILKQDHLFQVFANEAVNYAFASGNFGLGNVTFTQRSSVSERDFIGDRTEIPYFKDYSTGIFMFRRSGYFPINIASGPMVQNAQDRSRINPLRKL